MGLVRITSWYPNFNGSHFGLPPSEIHTDHRMTGLPPKMVWTMTYSHRPHWVTNTLLLLEIDIERKVKVYSSRSSRFVSFRDRMEKRERRKIGFPSRLDWRRPRDLIRRPPALHQGLVTVPCVLQAVPLYCAQLAEVAACLACDSLCPQAVGAAAGQSFSVGSLKPRWLRLSRRLLSVHSTNHPLPGGQSMCVRACVCMCGCERWTVRECVRSMGIQGCRLHTNTTKGRCSVSLVVPTFSERY